MERCAHPRLGGAQDDEDDAPSDRDSKAKELGTLVHRLVLNKGGDIVVIQADSFRTNAAKAERDLAKAAGLQIGERGGIRVDEHMRTSDPDILAVGDAVEVKDYVTGQWTLIPLAGPANRQGRIAADVICGRDSRYRGTQGTSICKIFEATIASTGASEKVLLQCGDKDFEKIYLYPNSHAGYYPGAEYIAMKVIFRKSDGRLLGAQVLGAFIAAALVFWNYAPAFHAADPQLEASSGDSAP